MRGLSTHAAALALVLAATAWAQQPPLGGGFGRPTATRAPAATPAPTATPTQTPTPEPVSTRPPAPTATPPASVTTRAPAPTASPTPAAPAPAAEPVSIATPLSFTPAPLGPQRPLATATPVPPSAPRASAPPSAGDPGEESRRATASVSVGYILVPFVVTDLKGHARRDLKAEDVTLLVEGRPVATDLFERGDDAPVSFTILLDGSGSMGLMGKMDGARAAISALLEKKRPGDDFALHVFSEGSLREVVAFTSDGARIRRAARDLLPFGKTALYDALAKMPDRTLLGKNGVRAILLLTDGIDNASALTLEQLDEIFSGVDVPVYPIGIRAAGAVGAAEGGRSADALVNVRVLGDLARMSGGRLSIVDDASKLPLAVEEIERDLRSQYVTGFTPTGKGGVKFRSFSLRIAGPAYRLRVRAGYRGTEPPLRDAR